MVDVADKTSLLCVLFFDCPIYICIERCLKRGAAGSDRTYDNVESSKKKTFRFVQQDTLSIIENFKSKVR